MINKMKKLLSLLRSSFLWVLLVPYGIYYTGCASNQLVFFCNDGKFPVRENTYAMEAIRIKQFAAYQEFIAQAADPKLKHEDRVEAAVKAASVRAMAETGMNDDDYHCFMTSKTHLNLLADNFNFHEAGIYSVGDGLLYAGEFLETPAFIFWLALVLSKLYKEPRQVA